MTQDHEENIKPIVLGNQGFIEKEIKFFIENFWKKAVNSGLNEDCFIPIKDERDRNIRK